MSFPGAATAPPPILGIDHLKLPTASIPSRFAFYTTVLRDSSRSRTSRDAPFAVILEHAPTALLVELRLNAAQAAAQRGWDAVTLSVATRADLETSRAWLVARGIECRRVLKGFKGWTLVAVDPDGAMVRWYCKETHEWDENVEVGCQMEDGCRPDTFAGETIDILRAHVSRISTCYTHLQPDTCICI
ncbi:hypothetical protein GGX14DRAFT_395504 [Mycena pura]|uniref:VOC domain-containing protein n=1 Tax=Mycena pura TaxID=153505 RepID=A0AAD6VJL2_9AGAR|nr:hypothetical protein GGX14DRAFT_395504 [Mycena pura]